MINELLSLNSSDNQIEQRTNMKILLKNLITIIKFQ